MNDRAADLVVGGFHLGGVDARALEGDLGEAFGEEGAEDLGETCIRGGERVQLQRATPQAKDAGEGPGKAQGVGQTGGQGGRLITKQGAPCRSGRAPRPLAWASPVALPLASARAAYEAAMAPAHSHQWAQSTTGWRQP